jgi:hypothetical protein
MKVKIGQDGHRIPQGEQCRCPVCHLMFGGEQAFDLHRTGAFDKNPSQRRCRRPEEFAEVGLVYSNDRDEWQRECHFPPSGRPKRERLGVGT